MAASRALRPRWALAGIGPYEQIRRRRSSASDHLRGRLASIELISYTSGPLLGNAEAGAAASLLGVTRFGGVGTPLVTKNAGVGSRTAPVLRS
jgi:hypothetical protein